MLGDQLGGLIAAVSQAVGGPYHAAHVITVSAPVMEGGSIVTPGTPTTRDCLCQVDAATEAMRAEAGFTERDVRLLILSLVGGIDTDATVEVLPDPLVPPQHVGTYSVQSVGSDALGAYWECRGRRAV